VATPTGKQPRGHSRTSWSDYISNLAWSHLGVEPAKLPEIAVDPRRYRAFLGQGFSTGALGLLGGHEQRLGTN